MQKKIFALFLMLSMIFTLAVPAKADDFTIVRLNQAIKGETPITASGPIPGDLNNNPSYVDGASTSSNYAFWCFIANSGPSDHADIIFLLPDGTYKEFTFKPSVTLNSNDHYNIITPAGYKVEDGKCYYTNADNNQIFTLSHSYTPPQKGSLKVTANVVKQHEKNTYQPIWQREIQPVYQKIYQPVWQKVYQPVWQKEIQPVWQKVYQPVWQKVFQPYNVPTFEKQVSYAMQDTLVTRLQYTGNTKTAIPDANFGGAFKNGQTYVKLDVAAASASGGVWYTIADSSPNNGKKTPDQYNIPINYQYNVKIADGKLTISFDSKLVSANVGAYVVNRISDFPGNAPKHYPNTVTVNMPQNPGAYVYLYVHIAGGIQWYTTGDYVFAGWRYDHTDMLSDKLIENQLVSDSLICNDVADDYFVRNDVADDYYVRDDFVREDFVRNDTAADYFVRNDLVKSETVTDQYNAIFNLVVTNNADGQIVYNGQLANNGEIVIPNLNSGVYSVTLSGDDIATQTKTVIVTAPDQAVVAFDDLPVVTGAVENVYLDKTYLPDIILDKTYIEDIYLDKIYLEDQYLDKTYLPDIILDKIYLDDQYLDKIYLPDIVNVSINLGNDTDPFGPYAVRLN